MALIEPVKKIDETLQQNTVNPDNPTAKRGEERQGLIANSLVKPVTGTVDKEATVQGQLTNVLDSDNPYVQQQERYAQNQANRRGLINSTMAASAGREAAINAAMPIAQQDATTFANQQQQNQSYVNKFRENQQSTQLNKELATHDSDLAKSRMAFEQENKEVMARLQSQLDMEKESHSNFLREQLELAVADKKLSNDMKVAYAQEMSRIMTESQTQIGQVGSSDRKPEQQKAAIDQIIRQRDSQIVMLKSMMQESTTYNWFS